MKYNEYDFHMYTGAYDDAFVHIYLYSFIICASEYCEQHEPFCKTFLVQVNFCTRKNVPHILILRTKLRLTVQASV